MKQTPNLPLLLFSFLMLLCGVCLGMLLPRQEAPAQPLAVAALSYALEGEGSPSGSQNGPALSENDVGPGNGAAMPAGEDGSAPATAEDAAASFSIQSGPLFSAVPGGEPSLFPAQSPLSAPAPTPANLFAITLLPGEASLSAAPTASPAATPSSAPAAGFAIQVVREGQATPAPKRVLIYHTHTYEAYQKPEGLDYRETEPWRTADQRYSVVRVGQELAGLLRGLGLAVEHDVTAFEPPELSGAYTRSLEMLTRRTAAGEHYDLVIDLHRDAYPAAQIQSNTLQAGGAQLARLMLLIGRGDGQTSAGYAQKPDWESNLRTAQAITDALNAQQSGLCKPVMIKSGRYNQHASPRCLLIEVGNNQNTLAQALAAMPYLADAVFQALEMTE